MSASACFVNVCYYVVYYLKLTSCDDRSAWKGQVGAGLALATARGNYCMRAYASSYAEIYAVDSVRIERPRRGKSYAQRKCAYEYEWSSACGPQPNRAPLDFAQIRMHYSIRMRA